ncbi:aminoglycoside phosphotransferase family protein [Roseobacter sinensis]|uniref:Aminoglycoside phosphotransferase family protein n=1 Tax=Roseobacter sinensis TaxID=2931391 RepID=A0ABT3BJ07_9RHOB|nr:aminoglycoside phosphotransferase family protein [Roseobacter sp. WL0113]MCV3273339.1 aminoglycoside phosphotransferase family protein [Roseobacter sp. WL0113]
MHVFGRSSGSPAMSLQPSSRAVAERDPALPGLKLLLDEAALARQLGARTVTRVDLRYKPGVSCVVGLRVVATDWGEQWFCAKAFTAERFEQIKQRTHWHTGPWRVRMIEDQRVALIPPQLDRTLKGLYRLLDPDHRSDRLAKITGRVFSAPDLHIMRYKPNRRLVAQVTDGVSGPKALLKIQRPGAFDAAKRGAEIARQFGGPEVLAVEPRRGAITTEWLPGVSLCPVNGEADHALFRLAGARIAQHHRSPCDPPILSRASEVEALRRVVSDVSTLLPDHADRLAEIGARAKAVLLRQGAQTGLIHGDLSADQVIAENGELSIIDWDRTATGDQGRDLGCFLARLDMQRLGGLISAPQADELRVAFLEGYRSCRVLPGSHKAQHICHLVLLLTEPFRTQAVDWHALTVTLMTHIEALLSPSAVMPTDEALPYLTKALSAEVMGPLITDQTGLALTSPPLLTRHKPGQRALVRYECQTPAGDACTLLGKMRSKGPDRRTPAMQSALRAAGLDGEGPNKTGVPRVIDIENALALWFMEEVPGTCLRDLQDDGQTQPFFRTGAALGHFHKSAVVPGRSWSRAQELAVLAHALGKAERMLPSEASRLKELLSQAEDALGDLPAQPPAPIHRDFYPDQVIIDEGLVWLIDLDLVALGDPAIDVGNFLAHLAEYAIRKTGTADAAEPLQAAFLSGYQSTGFDLPRRSVETMSAISLMRHIYISRRFEDRHHTTSILLNLPWLDARAI